MPTHRRPRVVAIYNADGEAGYVELLHDTERERLKSLVEPRIVAL